MSFYSKLKTHLDKVLPDQIGREYNEKCFQRKTSNIDRINQITKKLSGITLKKSNSVKEIHTVYVPVPNTERPRLSNNNDTKVMNDSAQYWKELFRKEKEKNAELENDIIILHRRIDELESEQSEKKQNLPNQKELLKEIKELQEFKENVYQISQRYDEINESIIESLREIEILFQQMSKNKFNFNTKMIGMEKIKGNFEEVIRKVLETLNAKQDEYNYLLSTKNEEIKNLLDQIEQFKEKNVFNAKEYLAKTAWLLKKRRENNDINLDDYCEEYMGTKKRLTKSSSGAL